MSLPESNPSLKKIERRLENSGLYYLQRYTSSKANFEEVMRRKILKWDLSDKITNDQISNLLSALIQKFESLKYLNDTQYALMKIRSSFASGKSKRWIEQYLTQKSLSKEDIQEAYALYCEEVNRDEDDTFNPDHEAAVRYAMKKRLGPYSRKQDLPPELLQKHLARLVRAGFTYNLAKRILTTPLPE
ncbi:MAG: RecX family transcriptional regulator [Alphaproteobacteria bacterium]|jgi:regulatory protein|nr:RecX family transcriptional regulator [Alphaproteobacteria bacterium]MBP9877449.1 RecX family transcriptional regulator [Alphaproteobacteria bacterium]